MLTPEDLDNIQTRQKLASLEMKEGIIEAMEASFDKHYDVAHKPLKDKVELHSRLFWIIQGAWGALVAWFKFGGHR